MLLWLYWDHWLVLLESIGRVIVQWPHLLLLLQELLKHEILILYRGRTLGTKGRTNLPALRFPGDGLTALKDFRREASLHKLPVLRPAINSWMLRRSVFRGHCSTITLSLMMMRRMLPTLSRCACLSLVLLMRMRLREHCWWWRQWGRVACIGRCVYHEIVDFLVERSTAAISSVTIQKCHLLMLLASTWLVHPVCQIYSADYTRCNEVSWLLWFSYCTGTQTFTLLWQHASKMSRYRSHLSTSGISCRWRLRCYGSYLSCGSSC